MNGASLTSEELYLKISKFIILFAMTAGLLVALGALVYSAYHYMESARELKPTKKIPSENINPEEYISKKKELFSDKSEKSQRTQKNEPRKENDDQNQSSSSKKYHNEAKSIVTCMTESIRKPEIKKTVYDKLILEDTPGVRASIENTASLKSRGDQWVNDFVRFYCQAMRDARLIELRTKYGSSDIYEGDLISFHINRWDEIQQQNQKLSEEQRRAEESRVATAKGKASSALITAAAAFGVFITFALYLTFVAIESNLRNINRNIENFRKAPKINTGSVVEPSE